MLQSRLMSQKIEQLLVKLMKFVGNIWSVAAKFVGSLVLFLILMVMLFGNLGNQASQAKLSEKVVRPGDKNEKLAIVNLNGVIVARSNNFFT